MKKLFLPVILVVGALFLFAGCASTSSASQKSTEVKKESKGFPERVNWLEVPSLKDSYSGIFENIGVAVNERDLQGGDTLEGLVYHFSSITMENEFKPQFMFNWQKPNSNGTFTSSKGVTIEVPTNVPSFTRMDKMMNIAKSFGLRMRGHVLVWHSQTEASFFRENYNASGALVDKETMDARQEWYIKTILEHVKEWEDKYNDGKRLIYCWDVVNEAVSDNATVNAYLRTNSDWYAIFKSDEFIVNAFRYANKYAPADVQLAYNDYSCTSPAKTGGILKVIDAIQAAEKDDFLPARIDVIGMQSHVGLNNPQTSAFDIAIRKFLEKNIDVQITELDVNDTGMGSDLILRARYKALFQTFKKYQKVDGGHGISGVTFWGINDERSWISKNGTMFPLLFTRDSNGYLTKPAFFGCIEAASEE